MLESSQRIFCSFADLARCSTRNAVPGERKNIAAKASPNPFMTMRAVLQGLSHNTGKSSVPCSEGLGLQKTSYSTCFFLKCAKVWKDKFGLVLALYWNYSLYSPGHVGHVRSVVLPSDPLSVSLCVRIAKYKSGRKQIDQILCQPWINKPRLRLLKKGGIP